MDKGLWAWPPDMRGQTKILKRVATSPHLMSALQGMAKSKDGLSNPELDELLADNSNWMTLWSVRQLLALGFIEYRVDLFGGPARYMVTELGRNALSTMAGKPAQQNPPGSTPPTPQPLTPKTA